MIRVAASNVKPVPMILDLGEVGFGGCYVASKHVQIVDETKFSVFISAKAQMLFFANNGRKYHGNLSVSDGMIEYSFHFNSIPKIFVILEIM